jgi:hypothetical protein
MNNPVSVKAAGAGVSLLAAALSWVDAAEQLIRLAGSFVALVSGLVFLYFTLSDRLRRRRHKHKNKKDTHED